MSHLIDTYTAIITAAGLTVKDDGSIFKKEDRYFVKGKPLMIPSRDVLKRSDCGEKLIFHPLAEAAAKGESDVLEDLRNRFTTTLNASTGKMVAFFLALGAGEMKLTLDPEQIKVMGAVKNVGDKESRDILAAIQATARGEGKRTPLIKIYLSRRPHQEGKVKYFRTAVVTFPLYQLAKEELATKTKAYMLMGVPFNKKGLESFCHLMEFIFPGIDTDKDAYNQGSTSQIAPFADALFRAVGGLMSIFNEKVDLFKETKELEKLRLPTSWLDVIEDMDSLFNEINRIPLQPNADGKARVADVQTGALAVQTTQPVDLTTGNSVNITQAPSMMQHQQPQQQVAQQQTPEPEYITVGGLVRRNPNFLKPAVIGGHSGFGPINKLDPYASPLMLPNNTQIIQQPNPYGMPQQLNQYGMPQQQNNPYGMPQQQNNPYGMPQQQNNNGRLPGLNF